MLPARQRLGADKRALAAGELRLEQDLDLIPRECAANFVRDG